MQEVGVPAALSVLHKWRDLQRRLNSQRLDIWNIVPVSPSVYVPVPIVMALVLTTSRERDFELKCANPDLGLLRRV